jgi:hypothetical protein
VPASFTNTFFVRSNGAAKIAFVISGSTTQAGSPDTVDIYAVQTTAIGCGTVNPQTGQAFTLASPNVGTAAASPMQVISDALSQGFVDGSTLTNPVGTGDVIHIWNNATTATAYLDIIQIICDFACSFSVYAITTNGTGCIALAPANMKLGNATASLMSGQTGCTGIPVGINFGIGGSFTASGGVYVYDARGLILPNGAVQGFMVQNNIAGTGHISAHIKWYEK